MINRFKFSIILTCQLLLCGTVTGQTVTTLLESDLPHTKKNLVIIGDGFQAGNDQTIYNNYVENIVIKKLFKDGPLWEDMNAFNIYRINIDSVDSGVTEADVNGNVITARDTALDMRFVNDWNSCWFDFGPESYDDIRSILNEHTPGWDYFFVVLNEARGGGCSNGSSWLVVTTGAGWSVPAHEMGHMVGDLGDEYCRAGTYTGDEPVKVNITINTDRDTLKWKQFVDPATPIPTSINPNPGNGVCTNYNQGVKPAGHSSSEDAGLYEGAFYQDSGVYRPVENGRMRSNTPPFGPVCYHQMKEMLEPFHEYSYLESYVGDFTGDGLDDLLVHNANSIALYKSVGTELEPIWILTGEIDDWGELNRNDRFLVANFDDDNDDDLFIYRIQGTGTPRFGLLRSTGAGFELIRRFDGQLPGWGEMRQHDVFIVGDFNGDKKEDLYVFNANDWCIPYLAMIRSTGTSLSFVERYDGELPGWGPMREHDQFMVANIDNDASGMKDLYVFNTRDWTIGYLQLLRSTGNGLEHVIRYDGELPGWGEIRINDRFYVADFNKDDMDDLYVFNSLDWGEKYLLMLESTGNTLEYTHRFDGTVPGWGKLGGRDRFYVADIDGDNYDDLYVFNSEDWATEYLGVLRSTGNGLIGNWQADKIGGWDLTSNDRFLTAEFNGGAHWKDLFVRKKDWFGLLRSHGASVQVNALYPRWIHRHKYQSDGYW